MDTRCAATSLRRAAVRATVPQACASGPPGGRDNSSPRCLCMHSPRTRTRARAEPTSASLRDRGPHPPLDVGGAGWAAPAHWAHTAASVGGGSAPCLGAGLGAAAVQLPQWLQAWGLAQVALTELRLLDGRTDGLTDRPDAALPPASSNRSAAGECHRQCRRQRCRAQARRRQPGDHFQDFSPFCRTDG